MNPKTASDDWPTKTICRSAIGHGGSWGHAKSQARIV